MRQRRVWGRRGEVARRHRRGGDGDAVRPLSSVAVRRRSGWSVCDGTAARFDGERQCLGIARDRVAPRWSTARPPGRPSFPPSAGRRRRPATSGTPCPARAVGRCSSPARPASSSRENTTVAVPPAGMSPETVRTSGAANTCSAVDGVARRAAAPVRRRGRRARPTKAAAAASTAVRQRDARDGESGARCAGGCATVASSRSRSRGGRLDRGGRRYHRHRFPHRTHFVGEGLRDFGGSGGQPSLDVREFGAGTACSAYGVARAIRSGSNGSVMRSPGIYAARGWHRASAT